MNFQILLLVFFTHNLFSQNNMSPSDAFVFNGDWYTEITLRDFAKWNHPDLVRYDFDKEKANFTLTIYDEHNSNPDPEGFQMNAIDFLQKNQGEIIKSLYPFIKEKVYPFYQEFILYEDYPEAYPALNSPADLYNLLAINEVIIHKLHKGEHAYYILGFNCTIDYEHGLYITMHKLRPLGFGTMGDLDDRVILEDLGKNYEEYEKEWVEENNKTVRNFHQPHPKYGKSKPWQDDENRFYAYIFIENNDLDGLKKFLKEEPEANKKYGYTNYLLGRAIYTENTVFIDYLLSKNPAGVYDAFNTALLKFNPEIIKQLIANMADVNEGRGQRSYLYKVLMKYKKEYNDTDKKEAYLSIIDALFKAGFNPYLKEEQGGRDTFFIFRYFDDENMKTEVKQIIESYCEKYGVKAP